MRDETLLVSFENGYNIYRADKKQDKNTLIELIAAKMQNDLYGYRSIDYIKRKVDEIEEIAEYMLDHENNLFFIVKNGNAIGYIFKDVDKLLNDLLPDVIVVKDIYIHNKEQNKFAFVLLVGSFITYIYKTNIIYSRNVLAPNLEKLVSYRNYDLNTSIFSDESYIRLIKAFKRFKTTYIKE